MHGNDPFNSLPGQGNDIAGVTWTSPVKGTANLSGGLWGVDPNSLGRTSNWQISLNNTLLTNGRLLPTDSFNSSNPLNFNSGSGGLDALSFEVDVDDVVNLEIFRTSPQASVFVGVDLTIDVEVETIEPPEKTPEPSTILSLLTIGGTILAVSKKKTV